MKRLLRAAKGAPKRQLLLRLYKCELLTLEPLEEDEHRDTEERSRRWTARLRYFLARYATGVDRALADSMKLVRPTPNEAESAPYWMKLACHFLPTDLLWSTVARTSRRWKRAVRQLKYAPSFVRHSRQVSYMSSSPKSDALPGQP